MSRPLVKICGLTSRADAELAVAAGADLLGVILVPGTPRYRPPTELDWIRELDGAETVGVFRDATLADVESLRDRIGLDRVQLHGSEPDRDLHALGPATLRRIDPRIGDPWKRIADLSGRCLPLLDPGGGSGLAADWRVLAEGRPPDALFALAGGLSPDNVATAVALLRPAMVDVSSGVELARGVKDPTRLRAFLDAARSA